LGKAFKAKVLSGRISDSSFLKYSYICGYILYIEKMMKKNLFILMLVLPLLYALNSCEGCTKKIAKKTTEAALDVIEGASEAIHERGDKIGEKITDAAGNVAQGAGRSIARQLDEHAKTVASVSGRTLVQSLEGLEEGLYSEYYVKMNTQTDLCEGIALDYVGLIKEKPVLTAYFITPDKGSYDCIFDFCSDECSTVTLTKKAKIDHEGNTRYTSVSFAFNDSEYTLVKSAKCTKVIVKKNS
jgi:hypothetical protein